MRYSGVIGFAVTEETAPDVWTETIVERTYYGDVIRASRRSETDSKINSDLTINNQISIIADPFVNQNLNAMRYLTFMGCKWKINNIEVQFPRLFLTIGGVYNAQTEN